MFNLTKSIRVNTRAEISSFACIFSSMALKVLGKLVYFILSSGNHTLPVALYRFGKRLANYKLALKLQYWFLPVFFE